MSDSGPYEPEGMSEALRSRLADFLDAEVAKDWELADRAAQDGRSRWTVEDHVGMAVVKATHPTDPDLSPDWVMGFHPGEHPPPGVLDHVARHDPQRAIDECLMRHLAISLFRSSEVGLLDELMYRLARIYRDSPQWSDDFLG